MREHILNAGISEFFCLNGSVLGGFCIAIEVDLAVVLCFKAVFSYGNSRRCPAATFAEASEKVVLAPVCVYLVRGFLAELFGHGFADSRFEGVLQRRCKRVAGLFLVGRFLVEERAGRRGSGFVLLQRKADGFLEFGLIDRIAGILGLQWGPTPLMESC